MVQGRIMAQTRRNFVQMAGLGLTAAQYRAFGGPAASDKIRVGFIGLGGMGTGRLNGFLKHDDVTAVALCDVDHFRKVLERKDMLCRR